MPSTLETLSRGLRETLESLPPLAEQATELMSNLDQALLDLDLRYLSQRTRDVLATAEEKLLTRSRSS